MPKLKLYMMPFACSRVTLNALEEAGLDYEVQAINLLKGEQKSPDYLKIHPGGKVPALSVDGNIITENAAILIYLNALAPEAGLLPNTDDPLEQAKLYSDLIWCSSTFHPAIRQVRAPMRFTDGDTSGVFAKGLEYTNNALARVEERVSDGRWWHGDTWSIVDVYMNWCYTTAASADYSLDKFPAVQDHSARVQARPSFERAMARETQVINETGFKLPGS